MNIKQIVYDLFFACKTFRTFFRSLINSISELTDEQHSSLTSYNREPR